MSKIKFNCKFCNKEVIDYPSNKTKYCSLECRNKDWVGENNPNFNHKWDKRKRDEISNKILNQYENGRVVWNKSLTKADPRVMKYAIALYGNKFGIKNKGKKSPWTSKRNLENNPMLKEEARKKASEANKGRVPWNKGFGDYISGEKNSNWKGGISKEPYGIDWTNSKKKRIREMDEYKCQMCGKTQEEQMREIKMSLAVHHIDGCKKNCSEDNLIALCHRCNIKIEYLTSRPDFKEAIERRKIKI